MSTVNLEGMFLNNYLDIIRDDYVALQSRWISEGECSREYSATRIENFVSRLTYKVGKKYIKVITGSSVHSFIVNCDNDPKFKKGDVLLAASWASPARNKARGNILLSDTLGNITWVSPGYL